MPTLQQQTMKWKDIESYRVGNQILRKAQWNGLPESVTKYLNEYRWKSNRNYQDPVLVSDSELMTALNSFELKREQDFKDKSDRKMTNKCKASRSKSRSRTHPKYRERSSNSPPAKEKKSRKFCQICKDAGKEFRIYSNHNTEECHFRPKDESHKKAPKKDYRKKEVEEPIIILPHPATHTLHHQKKANARQML